MNIIQIDQIDSDEFSALDLREEAQGAPGDGYDIECYHVKVDGQAQAVEVLLVPDVFVTGVTWGGDATWIERQCSGHEGVKQAVADFFKGQS